MKNIVQTKTLSLMLALAMLLSLVPGMGLTAYAASIDAFGGQSVTISSDQTCTRVYVFDGSTLTVNQGVTLTLNMNDGHSFNLFYNSNLELHGTLAGSVGSGATWMDNTYINVYLSDGAKYTVTGLSCMVGDNYLRYYGYDAATDGNGTVSVMNGTTDVTASSIGYKTTTYTFTATPSSGYRFVSWTKGASGEVLGTDASINVTCEQNGQYQVYANFEVAHTHSFTYSASGDTITATCSVANCTLTDSKATLTIAAPALTTYGGTGSAAATLTGLTDFNSATGKTIAATDIKYVGRDGTTYTESTTAPTNAGKYTAKITVEEKTASVNYEIAKVNPTCTVPTGLTATYGQTLKDVTLPTGWAWSDGTQSVGNAGTNTFKANFTPTDTNNYNTVSNVNISVTVGKANPTYTVPTGLTATYGQTLANVTLPTGWSWADGTQSVGNVGTNTFKANFTPTDTNNYNTVSDVNVSVTVGKVNPTYTVPTGLTATYGQTLANVTLPTGWAWADGTQSVGNVGTNTFKANFTPADTANYNTVSNVNVSVTVGKANPTYTVPTGLTATYGQTLANVTLPTGWAWVDSTQSVGNVGTNSFKANFTPADTANYNTVSDVNVSVTVGKVNPTYTVPTGLTATYGQTLANVTLPTGWAWVDSTQSVGNVGTNTFKANFTPADTANYNTVSGIDVKVTVGKTAGKTAVISTDTMSYTSESICIEGVAGQEYIIVPKGTAVTDADWNTSVKPDPERDHWVFFENLKEATEYEIYARTAETETSYASEAVKANVYTTLSSIGYDYDSTLVGASITVEPESDVEGLTYKWYQDEVTEDDEGIIHHNLTEIPGASGSTYTFREEDAGKNIAVKIFSGDSEVGDFATDAPVASTAKVIFESKGGSDVETLTDAVYQSKIKAPADPTREGFAFDGWYWDEEFETPFDFEKDVITWTETTLYAKWTPNDYKITSVTGLTGANNKQWTKGGKDAVVITVKVSGEDNSFDHFTGVKLDGKELVKDVDYTVEKGSTIVTLKPETLEKLSVGEHTITVLFDNGEVNTTLTVLAANSQDATSPQTGDNSHMGLWIALMMLSLLGIAATLLFGRKKRVFDR